jgi:hypothetical protein
MKLQLVPHLTFSVKTDEGERHTLEVEAHLDNVLKLRDAKTGETILCVFRNGTAKWPLTRAFRELFASIMKRELTYEVEVISITPSLLMEVQPVNTESHV